MNGWLEGSNLRRVNPIFISGRVVKGNHDLATVGASDRTHEASKIPGHDGD
jgi:hypothetical protein